MNSAEIRVLEQMHHERLGGFLERLDGLRLPAHGLAVGRHEGEGDFSDLKGALIGVVKRREKEEEGEGEGEREGGEGGEGMGGGTNETGKGQFAQQEVGGALVAADFLQRERAGLVAVGFARAGEWVAGCEEQLANGYGNTHASGGDCGVWVWGGSASGESWREAGSLRWMSLPRGLPRPPFLLPALLMVFRGVARAAAAPPLLCREPVLVRAPRPERRPALALALGGIGERDEA